MKCRVFLWAGPLCSVATLVGCQSVGRLPGIDPTDYAYNSYLCNTSQVYQQTVPQLQGSVLEAMADLGYTDIQCNANAGVISIDSNTTDGRKAKITIAPQNTLSKMTVKIGQLGDEMVAQALIQRVAMNFGELPRTLIPMEPVLSRRNDPLKPRMMMSMPADGVLPFESEQPPLPGTIETESPFATSSAPRTTSPPVAARTGTPAPPTNEPAAITAGNPAGLTR